VITKAIVVILSENEYYVIELCLEHAAYPSSRAYCQADTSSQKILVSMDLQKDPWMDDIQMDIHTI
jgi:hypothetical protein